MGGEELLFAEREILERIDEYALYCFYLKNDEIVIGDSYLSPIRAAINLGQDHDPSFGIFYRRKGGNDFYNEFLWKDNGTGIFGDIFDLVRHMFGISRKDAMFKIMVDFGIIEATDDIRAMPRVFIDRKVAHDPVQITIKSKPFTSKELVYWSRFNIDKSILDRYNTTSIQHYWLTQHQKIASYPKGFGFAYRVKEKYQLYFPNTTNKRKKFRHNFDDTCVPGFQQLQYNSDLCIITKSFKDIQCLRSFGYEAVAPTGEWIVLPELLFDHLRKKYKNVLVLFDNDMKHNGDKYPFEKIYIPKILSGDKDTSDFCYNHGPKETALMLSQITGVCR